MITVNSISAYKWLLKEIREKSIWIDHKRLSWSDIDDGYDVVGTHTSLFMRSGAKTGYLRKYWVLEDRVEISLIINASQILWEHPEIARRWVRNGLVLYHAWLIENIENGDVARNPAKSIGGKKRIRNEIPILE